MIPAPPYPEVVLKKGRERSLKEGHPWLFSGALERSSNRIPDGALVDVLAASGKHLATGHYFNSSIAVRILAFQPAVITPAFLERRLHEAVQFRKVLGLVDNAETNAYRLVNAEADQLPGLIVDIYADCAVIEFHSAGMFGMREEVAQALLSAAPVRLRSIFGRSYAPGWQGYLYGSPDTGVRTVILENGLRYEIDWELGQKTGFFLDQRESRKLVRKLSAGRTVLNCFSYTGGFSISALAGGATRVVSVDSSCPALDQLERNINLNSVDPALHQALALDCFDYLKRPERQFDLVVLDPPAFAKHKPAIKNALRGYQDLNRLGACAVSDGGKLLTFSCSQLVSKQDFAQSVRAGIEQCGRAFEIERELSQAPCHRLTPAWPEGAYLKGLLIKLV